MGIELEFGHQSDEPATEEVKEVEVKEEAKEEEVEEKVIDPKTQALDSERARRKQVEKELKDLKAQLNQEKIQKEDEEKLIKEKENLKKELLEGDLFDEEVADKIVDTIGGKLLQGQIVQERKTEEENFDKEFSEFSKNDLYQDAEVYKPEIKELMQKGLTMEQAYRAAMPSGRFEQMRKDMEIEIEQKLLNSEKMADEVDTGHAEAKDEVKRTQYSKREQEIAQMTGMDIKEVHKRSKVSTLDEIMELRRSEKK